MKIFEYFIAIAPAIANPSTTDFPLPLGDDADIVQWLLLLFSVSKQWLKNWDWSLVEHNLINFWKTSKSSLSLPKVLEDSQAFSSIYKKWIKIKFQKKKINKDLL